MHERVQRDCVKVLRRGSKSFAMATRLLPKRLRGDAAILYTYCRHADDAIDTATRPKDALVQLHIQLDALFANAPTSNVTDAAIADLIARHQLPRHLFELLLEGFAWDAEKRVYATLGDLEDYAARVASTVGLLMTHLMGVRDAPALSCAHALGVAMQLTNIARDVGEDARMSRLYLPLDALAQAGLSPQGFLRRPGYSLALAQVIRSLLLRADALYAEAERGIAHLPKDCRLGIWSARLIYADIGRVLRWHQYNSIDARAYVSLPAKIWHVLRAFFWSSAAPAHLNPPSPQAMKLIQPHSQEFRRLGVGNA